MSTGTMSGENEFTNDARGRLKAVLPILNSFMVTGYARMRGLTKVRSGAVPAGGSLPEHEENRLEAISKPNKLCCIFE
jgi:hypothetical protein